MCSKPVVKQKLTVILTVLTVLGLLMSLNGQAKREKVTFTLPDTSAAEANTNRFTQYSTAAAVSVNRLNTDGFEKALENSAMELWLRRESASIRVVDKNSGYIWGELPADTVDNLNDYWLSMANSMLTLEYFDANNTAYQISLSDDRFEVTYEFDQENASMYCFAECYDIGIDIAFTISLAEDHLEIAAVKDSLDEYDVNKLSKLYFLPFFG